MEESKVLIIILISTIIMNKLLYKLNNKLGVCDIDQKMIFPGYFLGFYR